MWSRHRTKQELITIVIQNNTLTLSFLQRNKQAITLHAYKKISFDYEIIDGIIYNIKDIKKHICDFATAYRLHNPSLAIGMQGMPFCEKFYKTEHHQSSLTTDKTLDAMTWEDLYVGPSIDHDGYWYYVCGIPREYIFHYTLVGLEIGYPISILTSCTMAHFMLYNYRYAQSFRQSQLSLDLAACNFDISALLSADAIARCVRIHSGLSISLLNEYKTIGTMVGLFLAGGQMV